MIIEVDLYAINTLMALILEDKVEHDRPNFVHD